MWSETWGSRLLAKAKLELTNIDCTASMFIESSGHEVEGADGGTIRAIFFFLDRSYLLVLQQADP